MQICNSRHLNDCRPNLGYCWERPRAATGVSWALRARISMPNMTGRAGCRTMEMNGGSSVSFLARVPCVPCLVLCLIRGGNRRASRLPGEGADHQPYCAVEPSPGHIRCRELSRAVLESVPENGSVRRVGSQGKCTSRGRVNREVQTVNWEAGKKGAVETGVKSGLKKAHKPWIRGKKGAQTVN